MAKWVSEAAAWREGAEKVPFASAGPFGRARGLKEAALRAWRSAPPPPLSTAVSPSGRHT